MDSKMRAGWIAVITGLSLLLLGACHDNRKAKTETVVKAADKPAVVEVKASEQAEQSANEIDLPHKQEVRRSFKLAPGTRVLVSGINGLLEVETSETDTAEIYIVRSARDQSDFDDRNLLIEQQGDKLRIRVQRQRKNSFWSMLTPRSDERQRAYLKLPRQVQLVANGVNGATRIGEIGGRVELSGLNGPVTVARATGGAEIHGVNGNIEMTLAQFTEGVEVNGINGNIDLRFAGTVNANIEVRGVNGTINPELPNVNVLEQKRGRLEARVGNGGAPIEVHGVNGNINLLPATAQTAKANGGASGVAAK